MKEEWEEVVERKEIKGEERKGKGKKREDRKGEQRKIQISYLTAQSVQGIFPGKKYSLT